MGQFSLDWTDFGQVLCQTKLSPIWFWNKNLSVVSLANIWNTFELCPLITWWLVVHWPVSAWLATLSASAISNQWQLFYFKTKTYGREFYNLWKEKKHIIYESNTHKLVVILWILFHDITLELELFSFHNNCAHFRVMLELTKNGGIP